jgi:hemoglobin
MYFQYFFLARTRLYQSDTTAVPRSTVSEGQIGRNATVSMTHLTEASIARLVDAFYVKVRRDPRLGPIFEQAIGSENWPAHLERMCGFWSSVMLTTGRYKGNPLAVHAAVTGIDEPMFERWLELFEATAGELFPEAPAGAFCLKARRIAESLKLGLFFRPSARNADGDGRETAIGKR